MIILMHWISLWRAYSIYCSICPQPHLMSLLIILIRKRHFEHSRLCKFYKRQIGPLMSKAIKVLYAVPSVFCLCKCVYTRSCQADGRTRPRESISSTRLLLCCNWASSRLIHKAGCRVSSCHSDAYTTRQLPLSKAGANTETSGRPLSKAMVTAKDPGSNWLLLKKH